MLTIQNLPTQDRYVDALTLGPAPSARLIKYVVANKAVFMRVWPQSKSGTIPSQTDELLVTPETNVITDAMGVQFRSAVPGVPAQVVAQLLEPGDPTFGSGTPFSSTISSSGGISPGVSSVQIQKNGALVGTETALDFEDGGLLWVVTDDPPNTRVKVVGTPRIAFQRNGVALATEPILDFEDAVGAKWATADDAGVRVRVSPPASPVRQTNRIGGVSVFNSGAETSLVSLGVPAPACVSQGFLRLTMLGSILNATGVARDYPRLKVYAWSGATAVGVLDTNSIAAGAGIPSGGFQTFKLVVEIWTAGVGSAFGYATMLLHGTCASAAHTAGTFAVGTGAWDVNGSNVYAMGSNGAVALDNSAGWTLAVNVLNAVADPNYGISFDTGTVELCGF